MNLNWFSAKAAKEFGSSLARFYIERIPVDTSLSATQFSRKSADVLNKMDLKIRQFKQQERLNFYKTAQMGNAFKWTLKEAGYDDAYVTRLTDWLVTKI